MSINLKRPGFTGASILSGSGVSGNPGAFHCDLTPFFRISLRYFVNMPEEVIRCVEREASGS